jgi:pimeloyl-ACP methyl ester carboxylesterase
MPYFHASDGTRLSFDDEGAGTPLLCLAGLTRNGRDFDHLAPHLPNVRMIRPDYRGRGRSDWADPSSYSVPQEAADAIALLDHLGLERAAILGTSRGGLIAMWLAARSRSRLIGVALNDIGPHISQRGLDVIFGYLGRNPAQKTWEEAAKARALAWTGFEGVPHARWLAEVKAQYEEGPDGLVIRYDPRLRDALLALGEQPAADLWPLFDALAGLPLALIRGVNSDLLSKATTDEMRRRRPDMICAEVPGRGHVPFLDEPEALEALHRWIKELS